MNINMPALPGYYTTEEAAEKLGYANGIYLRQMCQQGKIPAYKVAKTWLIPETWVDEQEKIVPTGQGNRGVKRKED
ncbi:MAG: excisionase family DNA-binding protein [Bilophila wadsworthia]